MSVTGGTESTVQADASDEADDPEQYSRRGFLEKAATVGAAGAATGLAGCTGGSDGGTSGNGEQDFLWWTMRGYIPAETQAIRDAATGYQDAADANINLSTEVITWDQVFQEWSASLEGRAMPNVSEMACEHAVNFGYQGAALPNTQLFDQYDDWYDTISNWGQFDGDFWGLPWFMELRTTHVNMNLLEQAGISEPPQTWAELIRTGQAVTNNTDAAGFGTPGAADYTTGQNVDAFLNQCGGDFYGFNNEQFSVEIDSAASLFTHLWTLSLREQWDIAPGGWGGLDNTALEDVYRAGRVAMTHQPTDLARSLVDPQNGVNQEYSEVAEATELVQMPTGPNGERRSFMGGSCMTVFNQEVTNNDLDSQISMGFLEYMTQPDTLDQYITASAPNFMPVRSGQEQIELFTDNPTEVPDSWIETRLAQAPNAIRYGVSGAQRSAPFLGDLEGSTTGYSEAISGIIGSNADPRQALRDIGNRMRTTINDSEYIDYELQETSEGPSLADAPEAVQPWITGDGVPQIYNPYQ